MAQTYIEPGDVLTLTAPTGGVTVGVPVLIGSQLVIPKTTAAEAASFDGYVEGVFSYTKTASQAWSEGSPIYWNTSTSKFDSDGSTGPLVGVSVAVVAGGAGDTTGKVRLGIVSNVAAGVFFIRKSFTVAQVNAGATLLAAQAGVKYRMIDAATVAVGGAASAAFNILGTATTSKKLVSQAAAQSTENTLLRAGATGSTVLAADASFAAMDANSAITVAKDAGDVATATSIVFHLTYAMDPA